MAKANVTLPDGTTVSIDGTPEEVAVLIQRISSADGNTSTGTQRRRVRSGAAKAKMQPGKPKPMGPIDYIRELVGEGFFSSKRGLGVVRTKLEERAHIYPVTSLSPALVRLVRKRELRRIKEDGQWKYVNA